MAPKVAFNSASEASYVYILSQFGEFLENWSLRSNSVTRQVNFNQTKIGEKCQCLKIQMRHFGWFSNTVYKYQVFPKNWFDFFLEQDNFQKPVIIWF